MKVRFSPVLFTIIVLVLSIGVVIVVFVTHQVDENTDMVVGQNTFVNYNANGFANVNTEGNPNITINIDTKSAGNANVDVDTRDWLTYENEEWGISFMYPADWEVVDLEDPKAGIALRSPNYSPITSGYVELKGEFYVSQIDNNQGLSLEDLYNSFSDTSRFWFEKYDHTESSFGQNRVVKFTPFQEEKTDLNRIVIVVQLEKRVITFSHLFATEDMEYVLEGVFSTLKVK